MIVQKQMVFLTPIKIVDDRLDVLVFADRNDALRQVNGDATRILPRTVRASSGRQFSRAKPKRGKKKGAR